ncbi:MAG TPA: tetratricopeptide repeat protein [Pyrinomonadaceae bacterium]|jgi:tetratricopeptide (TPR) repeat protein|nr:tetratricopeptide repeat protein [Pyrinomonadaceae bacterium]
MKRLAISFNAAALLLFCSAAALAQSGATRPRRVTPAQPPPDAVADTAPSSTSAPASNASGASQGSTAHAFSLLQQKQYDAALREAKQLSSADAKNSEAWKIAGFAELGLKRYADAAGDLQQAADLQRAEGKPDSHTDDALAEAYFFAEKYEQALPLLVAETTRAGAKPDAATLYYRGIAEMNLKKTDDAERSFDEVIKLEPKNKGALVYLGQMAFARNDYTTAVNMLNRATLADPTYPRAWELLTQAYLLRARGAQGQAADADYLAAVRASDSLARLRNDDQTAILQGQALFFAKQYDRAAAVLEKAAASPKAPDATFFLLGYSYYQTKSYAKAIPALERAAEKTPDNADIYRLLGFCYETNKQYAKALAAYEKGLQLAPNDAYFKESADRVRPAATTAKP